MDPFRRFTSGADWAAVQGWQSQRVNWSKLRMGLWVARQHGRGESQGHCLEALAALSDPSGLECQIRAHHSIPEDWMLSSEMIFLLP